MLSPGLLSSETGQSRGRENKTVHADAPHSAHRPQALCNELLLLAETEKKAGNMSKATVNEAGGCGAGSPGAGEG